MQEGLWSRRCNVQALVAPAIRAEVESRDLHEIEIGGPITERVRAAKGNHCKFTGMVDGHVASHACQESTV